MWSLRKSCTFALANEKQQLFNCKQHGTLAQVVEQWTENPCVLGSTPRGTTSSFHSNPVIGFGLCRIFLCHDVSGGDDLQGRVGMVRARPQPEWQINCQSVHIGCGRAQGPPLQSGCKITHTIRYGAEKCKILLPKFNTWRQGQIERKKGSLPPFENAVGRFFAKKCCRYCVIASPLHRNGNAISP